MSEEIGVSKTAVYDKLNRLEPNVSKALVKSTALDLATIIHQLGGEQPEQMRRISSQNSRAAMVWGSQNIVCQYCATRLAGPLPGKSLVVLDPQLGLAIDLFPCEDGHAQERSLFPEVLETIEPRDLFIADRNFCTQGFLFGVAQKQAAFIIRQHENLPWTATSELVAVGLTEGGEVFEQTVVLSYKGSSLCCRRVLVKLDQPTGDGETQIALLTNLPAAAASSILVAQL